MRSCRNAPARARKNAFAFGRTSTRVPCAFPRRVACPLNSGAGRLLLTKLSERTCHMTKTQVLQAKNSRTLKTPSPDSLPPLVPKNRKRGRPRRTTPPVIQVPPAELLLDDNGTLAVAVGDVAVPVAALGAEEWPLPNELKLLLEPGQQPEVLAEVDLDDLLRELLSSVDAVADP